MDTVCKAIGESLRGFGVHGEEVKIVFGADRFGSYFEVDYTQDRHLRCELGVLTTDEELAKLITMKISALGA